MNRLGWGWGGVVVLAAGCVLMPAGVVDGGADVSKTIVASRRLKANVMLLLDNSGSLHAPINPLAPACPSGCGAPSNPCPSGCATRASELKAGLAQALATNGASARFGLTVFPTDSLCGAPGAVTVPLPSPSADDMGSNTALAQHAQTVSERLQALSPMGGTPTGPALGYLSTLPELTDVADFRDDFVLLITDGLPNCNEANPRQVCSCDTALCGSCGGGAACTAQLDACQCTTTNCSGTLCALGCLDRDETVKNVELLRSRGVRTVVVGLGAEVRTGNAPMVLNAMAEAGGLARGCPAGTDAECGAQDTCDPVRRRCARAFHAAESAAELETVLNELFAVPSTQQVCELPLSSRPTGNQQLVVLVDGEALASGEQTWSYDAVTNRVLFVGETCVRLQSSSTTAPVSIEIRVEG